MVSLNVEAERRRADALEKAGRLEEARAVWQRLAEADPANTSDAADRDVAMALHRMALLSRRLGRAGEAVALFQKALDRRKDPEVYLDFGNLLAAVGHWDGSAACHAAALRLAPGSLDAHLGLAVAHHQKDRAAEAEPHYRAVLAARPDLAMVWNNLGLVLQGLGRFGEAVTHHREAVRLDPTAAAWDNLGNALQRAGSAAEAEAAYGRALALASDRAAAWNNLSCLHLAAGRAERARDAAHRLAALCPDDPEALLAVGNAAHALASWVEAVRATGAAARLSPGDPGAFNNLGNALAGAGRADEAVAAFRQALALRPGFPQAALNLSGLLRGRRDAAGALAVLRDLLAHAPKDAVGWRMAGLAQLEAQRPSTAIQAQRTALALRPEDAETWLELGVAASRANQPALSIAAYRRALRLVPGHAAAAAQLIQQQRHVCDWRDLAALESSLLDRVRAAGPGAAGPSAAGSGAAGSGAAEAAVPPFTLLAMPAATPADQRRAAEGWAAEKARGVAPALRPPARAPSGDDGRLRIGYLSADFRAHAITWLVAEVLELHDRRRFAVHAYSIGPDDDGPDRRRVAAAVERFTDLRALSDADAAARIAADGLDVLVDLNGYTAFARTAILAARPAPVQAGWLGYPGTLAAGFVDYAIGDPVVIPPGEEKFYGEAVVRLPHCYQSNDRRRPIAATTPSRADCGLPEEGFVFCCFNSPYKLTPEVLDRWARLLRAVPGSVLWLYAPNPLVGGNLRREGAARGIDPDRLVLAPPRPPPDHLARHRLADLFLDTLPYNAHTTASDALWTGLPVLTRRGTTFAGRVAASLLRAAGLPELIAETDAEHEALALALAGDPARLAELRGRLAAGLAECPLFDTPRFTRHLEDAYRTMAGIHRAGGPPRGFDVPAGP